MDENSQNLWLGMCLFEGGYAVGNSNVDFDGKLCLFWLADGKAQILMRISLFNLLPN